MSSPDRQVSRMVGPAVRLRFVGGQPAIPSTSTRAIAPRQGGRPQPEVPSAKRAPLTRRDRATPGRRDGRKPPPCEGMSLITWRDAASSDRAVMPRMVRFPTPVLGYMLTPSDSAWQDGVGVT